MIVSKMEITFTSEIAIIAFLAYYLTKTPPEVNEIEQNLTINRYLM